MVKILIKSPKKVKKNLYHPNVNKLVAFYGLNPVIKFCQRCTYSNQKPNSEKEYKHKLNTKKPSLKLDKKNICNGVQYTKLQVKN